MIFETISRLIIERSVRRGASYLDRVHPGWEKKIDLSTFSIGTYERCVLGQLYPSGYQQGIAVLGLAPWDACKCGFDLFPLARWPSWRLLGGSRSRFDYLDDCWKRLIRARQQTICSTTA